MAETKKILNLAEDGTYIRLKAICKKWGASVFPKMRIADVVAVTQDRLSPEIFRYSLQAHFDFVVADEQHNPMFAVEFDSNWHTRTEQVNRDIKKNLICQTYDFPLLRISVNHLAKKFRRMDILSWFIDVWFCERQYSKAQQDGIIPVDEPFLPISIIYIDDKKEPWPFDLSMDAREEMRKLFEQGKCYSPGPSYLIGTDKNGNYHAIAYMKTTKEKGIYITTGMRNQLFPIEISDCLAEIAMLELYDRLMDTIKGKNHELESHIIQKQCEIFKDKYSLISSMRMERIKE
jgi:hypothetical protein